MVRFVQVAGEVIHTLLVGLVLELRLGVGDADPAGEPALRQLPQRCVCVRMYVE